MKFPGTWQTVPLEGVAEIGSGITKGRKPKGPTRPVPYLRVANVQAGHVDLTEVKEIDATDDEIARFGLERDDILMTEGGDPDKLGRGALWDGHIHPCIHQNHIFRVRLDGGRVFPSYFARLLGTRWAVDYFLKAAKQTTGIATINKTQLRGFPVPLPPLPEQKRIAAILDKADAIRRKRQEAIRLTEELLRSAFLDMFGDPVTNPKGWEVKKLGEVVEFVGGGTPSRARPEFFSGDICWATSKDMRGERLIDTQEHVTDEAIASSATKLVEPGTVLVVVKSKVLMHRLPICISDVPVCFGQDLKGLVLKGTATREFLLRSIKLSERTLLERARGANTEGLTLDHLRELDVPWPGDVQRSGYERLVASTRRLSATMATGDESVVLCDSLTQRAFAGAL